VKSRILTKAEFYGVNWFFQDCLEGSKVDGWDMHHDWLRYQANPETYADDPEDVPSTRARSVKHWHEALKETGIL